MDITKFLEARISEDEEVAREAARRYGEQWKVDVQFVPFDDDEHNLYVVKGSRLVVEEMALSEASAVTLVAHFDPGRVLAECAAKRRIMEQASEATSDRYSVIAGVLRRPGGDPAGHGHRPGRPDPPGARHRLRVPPRL